MQRKRIAYFLLLNVVVSALTTWVVLTVWDRTQRKAFERATSELVLPSPLPAEAAAAVVATASPLPPLQPHQVRPGETLSDIALAYGVTVDELLAINGLSDADAVGANQVIYVPAEETDIPEPDGQSPTAGPVAVVSSGEIEIISVVGVGDLETERVLLGEKKGGKHALAGWQLRDEQGHIYTFPQATLYENGQIVVNTRAGVDNPLELFWGLDEPVWESGEMVTLYDDTGAVPATFQVP